MAPADTVDPAGTVLSQSPLSPASRRTRHDHYVQGRPVEASGVQSLFGLVQGATLIMLRKALCTKGTASAVPQIPSSRQGFSR